MDNYHFLEYCRLFSKFLHVEKSEQDAMAEMMDFHWYQMDEDELNFIKEYSMQFARCMNIELCQKHAKEMQEKLKEKKMT